MRRSYPRDRRGRSERPPVAGSLVNRAIRAGGLLSVLRQIDTLDAARYAAGLPEPLATIVRRALATDARQRDITMADIAGLLEWRDDAIATA